MFQNARGKLALGIVSFFFVLALAGVSLYYWYTNTFFVTTEDAYVDAAIVKASPQVTGKILEVYVDEGEKVEAGQALARQDDTLLTPGANVDLAVIRAPISGTVLKKLVHPGEIGAPGVPAFMLADLDRVYITANVEEKRLAKVRPGQRVEVTVDGVPGRLFHGTVAEIGSAAASVFSLLPTRSTAGSFTKLVQRVPVKVELLDARGARLLPGMNAVVRIRVR